MIKKLHVQNYRSIKDLTIDLRPFNCFLGANNSGKSNLFDVFSFLTETVRNGLGPTIGSRGGESLRYYGAESYEPTVIEITLDSVKGVPGSMLHYALGFITNPPALDQERLIDFSKSGEARTLLSLRSVDGRNTAELMWGGQHQEGNWGGRLGDPFLRSLDGNWLRDGMGPMRALNQYILGFRSYYFKPDKLKSWGQATRTDALDRDGRNFASYLHHVLSGYRKYFDRIQEQLIKNFPEVEELLSPLTSGNYTEVGIRERWFPKKSASGVQLSDGLAGFLAHLVVLYGPDEPTLVSFEEPENYINPRLLERLVDMLKEASKDVQILISTHSVPLMNYLELEDLVLIERPEGGTKARRPSDQEDLRRALKGWAALGDAYASGALDAAA